VQAASLSSRTGPVAVGTLASEGQSLALLLAKGEVSTMAVEAVPILGRATAGQSRRKDTNQPFFEPAKQGIPLMVTVLSGSQPAAGAPASEPAKPAARRREAPEGQGPTPQKDKGTASKKEAQSEQAAKRKPETPTASGSAQSGRAGSTKTAPKGNTKSDQPSKRSKRPQ
jgi:hypothetical protein